MQTAAVPRMATTVARSFVAAAAFAYVFDLLRQTHDHLTNGTGRTFGDDFINYWSGGYLALHGRAMEVYSYTGFHAFEQSVTGPATGPYHYSYPPVMLLLTMPFALLPYVPALFVWLATSWYAFYRALLLAMPKGGALLLALATPAVLVNAIGGQNGAWTAALLCGGLGLIERRPAVAGVLLGLMIYKPQLGLLLPVALIAGRHWRVFASAALTAVALVVLTALLFGPEIWLTYAHNLALLRQAILEDGTGVWNRFVSVFVAARLLGASVETAYVVQAFMGLIACAAVAVVWWRAVPAGIKNAVLVLGTCFATPYLQDYDMVFGAVVVAWLVAQPLVLYASERALLAVCALILLVPLVASALVNLTGLVFGPLFILPAFALAVRAGLAPAPTGHLDHCRA
jgi:arabinofuranan 3-O-arabinosyltransferase